MSAAVPKSSLTSTQLLKLANFRREDADALDAALGSASVSDTFFSAKDYGAVGDGVTDDTASIARAVVAWKAAGSGNRLVFPPGSYLVSSFIDVSGVSGSTIEGSAFATIIYGSDNTGIVAAGSALLCASPDAAARSAIVMTYCTEVTVRGITFVGGNSQQTTDVNVGCGIYASHCTHTVLDHVQGRAGYSYFAQDGTADSTGTVTSLTYSAGTMTLVGTGFSTGHRGARITISGATNPSNGGTFRILTATSTTITYANAAGVTEGAVATWTINDGDRDTIHEHCMSIDQRGVCRAPSTSAFLRCYFERPLNYDLVGKGGRLVRAGSTITFTKAGAGFRPSLTGKRIRLASSASPGNNGVYVVTYVSDSILTWTNASGATEAHAGTYHVINGDKTGVGAGVAALVFSAGTVTLTASTASFVASDVGKVIRVANATSVGNCGAWPIASYVSPTVVTYANAFGVSEAFSEAWSIDAFDHGIASSNTYGSTHGIYIFAGSANSGGRDGILVDGCVFRGIRTTAVKASGSGTPIKGIRVVNSYFFECGAALIAGADDAQQHNDIFFEGNVLRNVGIGRTGWTENVAVSFLGAHGVVVRNSTFSYDRNAVKSVDGIGIAGVFCIQAAQYVIGRSQPITDITITGNKFLSDEMLTTANDLVAACVNLANVGQLELTGADCVLNKAGNIMTMTSTVTGLFPPWLPGAKLTLVGSAAGNDIADVTIETVTNQFNLTFTNAGGAGGDSFAGTFCIKAPAGKRGGICHVIDNEFLHVGTTGVICEDNISPTIKNNTFAGVQVLAQFHGDRDPVFTGNAVIGRNSDTAALRFNVDEAAGYVSWPVVYDNHVLNAGASRGWGVSIGLDGGPPVDFPLLGQHGRCLPSDGKEEVVVAFGSRHTNLFDNIVVDDGVGGVQTYTFKATAPTGNQFSTFAELVALIAAQANIDCTDYGTGFKDSAGSAADVATKHLRIRKSAASTASDGTLLVTCTSLYASSLVPLNNTASPNNVCGGRGSRGAGPVVDKAVVWSQMIGYATNAVLHPDNAAAAALMAGSGQYVQKNVLGYDGGSNAVVRTGAQAGTEQWRWTV